MAMKSPCINANTLNGGAIFFRAISTCIWAMLPEADNRAHANFKIV